MFLSEKIYKILTILDCLVWRICQYQRMSKLEWTESELQGIFKKFLKNLAHSNSIESNLKEKVLH